MSSGIGNVEKVLSEFERPRRVQFDRVDGAADWGPPHVSGACNGRDGASREIDLPDSVIVGISNVEHVAIDDETLRGRE